MVFMLISNDLPIEVPASADLETPALAVPTPPALPTIRTHELGEYLISLSPIMVDHKMRLASLGDWS